MRDEGWIRVSTVSEGDMWALGGLRGRRDEVDESTFSFVCFLFFGRGTWAGCWTFFIVPFRMSVCRRDVVT